MQITNKKISDLKEYENNPRDNTQAVDAVANSIKEFGFKVPIIIDNQNIIIAGHTRYKAAISLGLTEVVTRNVASTFQTFVESLKKENKFDDKAQSNALRYAKEQILKELNDEAIGYISDNFKDVNSWLTTQIESTIYTLKK